MNANAARRNKPPDWEMLEQVMIDGNTLIAWGFRPGRWLVTGNPMRRGGGPDDALV
jgi:hypothetical protein